MEHTGPAYPNPSSTRPCDDCPVLLWHTLSDPADQELERHIRADQRRLDLRELQAAARDLTWLIDRFDENDPRATLDKIRRVARQLTTITERRSAA